MQTTLKDLIFDDQFGQGMPRGRTVKAVIPGGSSAPVLTAAEMGVALEFEAFKPLNSMAGSGGIIVMDDTCCMVRCLWRVTRFYAEESCGQCTPCREGMPWMTRLLRKIEEGRGEPKDLEQLMQVAPREMRRAWMTGFGNARLAGRDAIEVADLPSAGARRQPIGFMQ